MDIQANNYCYWVTVTAGCACGVPCWWQQRPEVPEGQVERHGRWCGLL
jgi:hypothetical protein